MNRHHLKWPFKSQLVFQCIEGWYSEGSITTGFKWYLNISLPSLWMPIQYVNMVQSDALQWLKNINQRLNSHKTSHTSQELGENDSIIMSPYCIYSSIESWYILLYWMMRQSKRSPHPERLIYLDRVRLPEMIDWSWSSIGSDLILQVQKFSWPFFNIKTVIPDIEILIIRWLCNTTQCSGHQCQMSTSY